VLFQTEAINKLSSGNSTLFGSHMPSGQDDSNKPSSVHTTAEYLYVERPLKGCYFEKNTL
jgi:hypothetical protein